jgi:hypothetical protein
MPSAHLTLHESKKEGSKKKSFYCWSQLLIAQLGIALMLETSIKMLFLKAMIENGEKYPML